MSNFMSRETNTEKEAQDLHEPQGLFDPAAVFKNKQDKFVMVRLRNLQDWPPHSDIAHVEDLTNMQCVSVCSPMLMIWKAYKNG